MNTTVTLKLVCWAFYATKADRDCLKFNIRKHKQSVICEVGYRY